MSREFPNIAGIAAEYTRIGFYFDIVEKLNGICNTYWFKLKDLPGDTPLDKLLLVVEESLSKM